MGKKVLRDSQGKRIHPYVPELCEELKKGEIGRREFLRTACLLGVSAPAAYALAGGLGRETTVPAAKAATPQAGGSVKMAMRVREIADPATVSSVTQSNQMRGALEFLTKTGEDNVTRPYLSEGWEVSDDLKTWTFTLRQDVTWSNGDRFNADDVVFNMTRWLDPATGSSNLGLFNAMVDEIDTGQTDDDGKPVIEKRMTEDAVEKVDDYTVRFHLNAPELAMPENFYNYTAAMAHRGLDEAGGNFAENPVTTGPYTLAENVVGERCVLQRREGYWGQAPYLDEIQFIDLGDDPSAVLGALASRQVDMAYEAQIDQLGALEAMPGLNVYEAVTAQTGVARMQVTQKPFDDKRVRQALVACMDHKAIAELAYRGRGAAAENHHVAPIHPEHFALPAMKQDHAKAKQLLTEAGYPDGLDLKVDVASVTGPWELNAMLVLKEQLAPAGIRLDVNTMPGARFWDIWLETPFGFTPWTHRPLGVMVLNLAYRSGVPWNESKYNNPAFDRALTEASGILEATERRAKMEQVQKILQDDAVIAQPLWRSVFTAASEKVQGFAIHPTLYHDMTKVWLS